MSSCLKTIIHFPVFLFEYLEKLLHIEREQSRSSKTLTANGRVNFLCLFLSHSIYIMFACASTWGWDKQRGRQRGRMLEWKKNAGLLGHYVSLFSSKPAPYSSWDTATCTDTQRAHKQTHIHGTAVILGKHRWWACGRQIHLRSVPAQRVVRELPNQAKVCRNRLVLGLKSLALNRYFL